LTATRSMKRWAYGADAVLLIVAVLGERLGEFIRVKRGSGP